MLGSNFSLKIMDANNKQTFEYVGLKKNNNIEISPAIGQHREILAQIIGIILMTNYS